MRIRAERDLAPAQIAVATEDRHERRLALRRVEAARVQLKHGVRLDECSKYLVDLLTVGRIGQFRIEVSGIACDVVDVREDVDEVAVRAHAVRHRFEVESVDLVLFASLVESLVVEVEAHERVD